MTIGFRPAVGRLAGVALGLICLVAGLAQAQAGIGAYVLFDARTGEVIDQQNAHQTWYPASVTKLMTAYVAFRAVRQGRVKFTSPVVMSPDAAAQQPSKIGFPVGTVVTLDNALKMMLVKSANDIAWAIAEAVAGSKDAFVGEMNDAARRLGMSRTRFANPNGWHDEAQFTTARDLGLLARALIREFPEYEGYFRIPAIQLGRRILRNTNHLLTHFPGTDGMKTGFTCSSGFNLVATATRNGRRLVAVVLGGTSSLVRAEKTAELFLKGFGDSGGGFFSRRTEIDRLTPGADAVGPIDQRANACGPGRQRGEEEFLVASEAPEAAAPRGFLEEDGGVIRPNQVQETVGRGKTKKVVTRLTYLSPPFFAGEPIKVFTGGADPLPATATAMAPGTAATPPPTAPGAPSAAAPGLGARVPAPPPAAAAPPAPSAPLRPNNSGPPSGPTPAPIAAPAASAPGAAAALQPSPTEPPAEKSTLGSLFSWPSFWPEEPPAVPPAAPAPAVPVAPPRIVAPSPPAPPAPPRAAAPAPQPHHAAPAAPPAQPPGLAKPPPDGVPLAATTPAAPPRPDDPASPGGAMPPAEVTPFPEARFPTLPLPGGRIDMPVPRAKPAVAAAPRGGDPEPRRAAEQPKRPAAEAKRPVADAPKRTAVEPKRAAPEPKRAAPEPKRATGEPRRPAAPPRRSAAQPKGAADDRRTTLIRVEG